MRAINKQQNIQFNDMIFFDDEYGNIERTGKMGVSAIHCRELVFLYFYYWTLYVSLFYATNTNFFKRNFQVENRRNCLIMQ